MIGRLSTVALGTALLAACGPDGQVIEQEPLPAEGASISAAKQQEVLQWTGWAEIGGATTDATPAAAGFMDRMYLFIKSARAQKVLFCIGARGAPLRGSDWSEIVGPAEGTTDAAPAAAALGPRLYVVARRGDNRVYVNSLLDGKTEFDGAGPGWSEIKGNGLTGTTLGVSVLRRKLYVLARGLFDNRLLVNDSLGGAGASFTGWRPAPGIGNIDTAPTAAPLGPRLFGLVNGLNSPNMFTSIVAGPSLDGHGYEWAEIDTHDLTKMPLAAAGYGNRLYAAATTQDGTISISSSDDTAVFDAWTAVPGHFVSDAAPALAVLRKRMYLFAKRRDGKLFVNSAVRAEAPKADGSWAGPFPAGVSSSPIYAVNGALVFNPTTDSASVLVWSGTAQVGFPKQSQLWDPATMEWRGPQPFGDDLFCATHAFLPDGRLLVMGGSVPGGALKDVEKGIKASYTFDPVSESWTRGADMQYPRWYPTAVALGNGKVDVFSGFDEGDGAEKPGQGKIVAQVEEYDPELGGSRRCRRRKRSTRIRAFI